MGKFGKSENRTCGQTGHCPAMSGVRQPDGHGHLPRYMSCLSGLRRQRLSHNRPRRHSGSITSLADRLDRGPSVSDGYAAGTTHFHESVRVAFNHP
jgi:hypothetical protein